MVSAGCQPLAACSIIYRWIRLNTIGMASIRFVRQFSFASSVIPTMHFQKSLPRLSIPELKDSVHRFQAATSPFLTASETDEMKRLLDDFEASSGKTLQALLQKKNKNNPNTSYISDFWYDMYLKDRRPIPLTHTPFMTVMQDPIKLQQSNVALRCTNFIISALNFKSALDSNKLQPDIYYTKEQWKNSGLYNNLCAFAPSRISWFVSYLFGAFPLDMSQYNNLFSATRKPDDKKDILTNYKNSKHIIFFRAGKIFSVQVIDDDGKLIDPSSLRSHIEYILCTESEDAFPLPALTTLPRDEWTVIRKELENQGNSELLHSIDSAIFVVTLENRKMLSKDFDNTHNDDAKFLLTGDGYSRWFDKALNLVFTEDGNCTVQMEHSGSDGIPVVRLMTDVLKDTITNPAVLHSQPLPKNGSSSNVVKRLRTSLTPGLRDKIKDSVVRYQNRVSTLSFDHCRFPLGVDDCKPHKIGGDSLAQLVIQAAYYESSGGKTVPTYESCTTAAFKGGRTETLRSCTMHTKAASEALYSSHTDSKVILDLLQKCSTYHSKLTREAALGKGCDRHLFALNRIGEENGIPTHDLFSSEVFRKSNQFIISTSTLPNDELIAGGFGPVTSDGLGVGYKIHKDRIGLLVSSYPDNSATKFVKAAELVLDKIRYAFSKSEFL